MSRGHALAEIWERTERLVVYLALVALLFAEVASAFIPAIRGLLDRGGEIALLAAALLLVFRRLDDRLLHRDEGISVETSFGAAVNRTLDGVQEVGEVLLYAHSSARYYALVRNSSVRIKVLRVLLFEPRADDGASELVEAEVQTAAANWLNCADRVDVRRFRDLPTMHFMIVDGRRGVFGLFGQRQTIRVSLRDIFSITDRTQAGKSMVENCVASFEEKWLSVEPLHIDTPQSTFLNR